MLPAVSVIENVDAAANEDSRGFVSPGSAVDCTEIVHTSSADWVIELIREIRVNLKSTPSTIDNVEQTIGSLPVTVKVNVATPELPVERPKVTTGAVRSPATTDVVVVDVVVVDVVDEELVVVEVEDVEVEELDEVDALEVVVGTTVVVETTDVEVDVAVTTLTVVALTSRQRNCFLTFETQTTRLPETLSRAPSRTQTPPKLTDKRPASADEPTPPNRTPANNTATKLERNPNFTEKQHPI